MFDVPELVLSVICAVHAEVSATVTVVVSDVEHIRWVVSPLNTVTCTHQLLLITVCVKWVDHNSTICNKSYNQVIFNIISYCLAISEML